MPEGIDIPLATPVPVVAPTQDYDRVMFWLSIAPRDDAGTVDYTASLTVLPYRALDGGVIDRAPESMRRTVNIGSVVAAIAGGEPVGQASGAILQVLTQFLGQADFKA